MKRITFLLAIACIFSVELSTGQTIKVAEGDYRHFSDKYLGVDLYNLTAKYQYYIDANESLVMNGYFKAHTEITNSLGRASSKVLYRINGNYNNGKKNGIWKYEIIDYGVTINVSKFNSRTWDYDHFQVGDPNEIESVKTVSVEFKDDVPSGKATATVKEKGIETLNVSCILSGNFILGDFVGKSKGIEMKGTFDPYGRIDGEWIINLKEGLYIEKNYNVYFIPNPVIKKIYDKGVLKYYKVYDKEGAVIESCISDVEKLLSDENIKKKFIVDTFFIMNSSNPYVQTSKCIPTNRYKTLEFSKDPSKDPSYYLVNRNCSKNDKRSKFELNVFLHNSIGIGFLYECEEKYNSFTRELMLIPNQTFVANKEFDEFISFFKPYNQNTYYNSNQACKGLVNLQEMCKKNNTNLNNYNQTNFFCGNLYQVFEKYYCKNINGALMNVMTNLDNIQAKACNADPIWSGSENNSVLLGSNDLKDLMTENKTKVDYKNEIIEEFFKKGGKSWSTLKKIDQSFNALKNTITNYLNIPHASANIALNPINFSEDKKQKIINNFYTTVLNDIPNTDLNTLISKLDSINFKFSNAEFIKNKITSDAIIVIKEEEERLLEIERKNEHKALLSNYKEKLQQVYDLYVISETPDKNDSNKTIKKLKKKNLYLAYDLILEDLVNKHNSEKITLNKIVLIKELIDLNVKMINIFKKKTGEWEKELKNKVNLDEIKQIFDKIIVSE